MIEYIIKAGGEQQSVKAVTFTQGVNDLRFIGEHGAIVAIFTTFDWMLVVPAEVKPTPVDTSSTVKLELAGE